MTFAIPKRPEGKRLIMAPKRRLKAIQRTLLALLVEKLPVSDHAHAFRRARSIRTGAEPHVGRRLVLKLDLKDFFPSVTFARVRGLLIAYGYSYPVATTLAVLMTEAERQPVEVDGQVFHVPVGRRYCVQGAPTSPGICNALLLRLDHRLARLSSKHGLSYTRYADDLTFSGSKESAAKTGYLLARVRHIVANENLTVNEAKTRVQRPNSRQTVTGIVVNKRPNVSRCTTKRLRAILHQAGKSGLAAQNREQRDNFADWLGGMIAYVQMVNPEKGRRLREQSASYEVAILLQQLEMESCGKSVTREGSRAGHATAPVTWGSAGTDGQHAYFQLLHQGSVTVPADFIACCRPHHRLRAHHQALLANFFAQTEALARGMDAEEAAAAMRAQRLPEAAVEKLLPHRVFDGNRPATSILLDELTPRALGALIALYEHKVFVQSVIWDVNAFDQWGVELGKTLAGRILSELEGSANVSGHDSSTNSLINHYLRHRSSYRRRKT